MVRYKDYKAMKIGSGQSVGIFGEDVYAYEVLTGICSVPEYVQITKDEFDSFEQWQHETTGELGIMYEVHNRPSLCSAYKGNTEILEFAKELRCPICNESFLISGGTIPTNIKTSEICPICNKKPEPRMDLMKEIKKQLDILEIRMKDLGQILSSYYINPFQKLDMQGYVDVGNDCYYLRMNERGKVINEYRVMDIKKAAYWVLDGLLYRYEISILDETNEYIKHKEVSTRLKGYFDKMDLPYSKWYMEDNPE